VQQLPGFRHVMLNYDRFDNLPMVFIKVPTLLLLVVCILYYFTAPALTANRADLLVVPIALTLPSSRARRRRGRPSASHTTPAHRRPQRPASTSPRGLFRYAELKTEDLSSETSGGEVGVPHHCVRF
jgi:hypothetical protein